MTRREVPVPRDRREFLRLVKQHHPDRGGDPEMLAAIIAAWRASVVPATGREVVTAYRSTRGPLALLLVLREWHDRRTRPPRVQ